MWTLSAATTATCPNTIMIVACQAWVDSLAVYFSKSSLSTQTNTIQDVATNCAFVDVTSQTANVSVAQKTLPHIFVGYKLYFETFTQDNFRTSKPWRMKQNGM
jgi:hypothetical protein